jgi:hypothetical protein
MISALAGSRSSTSRQRRSDRLAVILTCSYADFLDVWTGEAALRKK